MEMNKNLIDNYFVACTDDSVLIVNRKINQHYTYSKKKPHKLQSDEEIYI